jgi:hypothetical protein
MISKEIDDGHGNTFTEVYEDADLAALIERGEPVTFRALEDEWNADYTVRTIKRAEIVERDTPC